MALHREAPRGGGFLPDQMLSPPPSSIASGSTVAAALPHPRAHPLKPGGAKESAFIRFVDQGILKIERRYAKRGTSMADKNEDASSRGYENFEELVQDVEKLFELIWVSGTPSLQVPYLLTLASMVEQYISSFPAAPQPTFRLLDRFDLAFASLLQGRHVETGETLPGFDTGRRVTGTEKVRMKSIVERTRGVVAEVMSGHDDEEEASRVEDVTDLDTADEMDIDESIAESGEQFTDIEMSVAKVYDRTVVELGDTIGNTPIGIISND
ncbi:uncharacterized protein PV09_00905 [Verruconis gallopava]|uniref:Meiotic recombination protein DMC1 n=1 Tax=Verruconis gallopava TaxID=253628 RepID=A0A0D2AQS8_9PEZI|nr:uncharacterized protein PV09_00905 [Verruconis gallopava]KIW09008.1 hypothetical protein PV09_00905 [Verruconis gallopava]